MNIITKVYIFTRNETHLNIGNLYDLYLNVLTWLLEGTIITYYIIDIEQISSNRNMGLPEEHRYY